MSFSLTYRLPPSKYQVENTAPGFVMHLFTFFFFAECHDVAGRECLVQTADPLLDEVNFGYRVVAEGEFGVQNLV